MINVEFKFMLVHMLRAKEKVSIRDLNEMSEKIFQKTNNRANANFNHRQVSGALEDWAEMFHRKNGIYITKTLGSEDRFTDNFYIGSTFDGRGIVTTTQGEYSEEKLKELRREILEMIEPGLLATGYNPFGLYR